MSVVSVVCCQVEVSATGRSLVQRSLTDCGVPLYDLETSRTRRPWPALGCCAGNKQNRISDVIDEMSHKPMSL